LSSDFQAPPADVSRPLCYLDPKRIYPTADVRTSEDFDAQEPIAVGYAPPYFFAIDGHRQLSSAIRAGRTPVAATLVAEAGEEIPGQSCERYLAAHATPIRVRDWEEAHGRRPAADGAAATPSEP
jgi:cytidylate kinase